MARLREVAFADFARRLRVRERRIPVQGMIETTFRCNLSCAHCYVNKKASDVAAQARELSFERLSALIDEIVDAGCLSLVLTGGEPLIRPDFPALYVHAIQRGLMVTVFTNGTLIIVRKRSRSRSTA
jgi:MoaA/NifB/PqqE/SkfB family radical SAM enzyme